MGYSEKICGPQLNTSLRCIMGIVIVHYLGHKWDLNKAMSIQLGGSGVQTSNPPVDRLPLPLDLL